MLIRPYGGSRDSSESSGQTCLHDVVLQVQLSEKAGAQRAQSVLFMGTGWSCHLHDVLPEILGRNGPSHAPVAEVHGVYKDKAELASLTTALRYPQKGHKRCQPLLPTLMLNLVSEACFSSNLGASAESLRCEVTKGKLGAACFCIRCRIVICFVISVSVVTSLVFFSALLLVAGPSGEWLWRI